MLNRLFPVSHVPFAAHMQSKSLWEGFTWPASWIADPAGMATPGVWMFRLRFRLDAAAPLLLHVTADERYELTLDGQRLGRGPEAGDEDHTFYESFAGELAAGEHLLLAKVWAAGAEAAHAKISVRPGFLLAAEGAHTALLGTGLAPWEVRPLPGYGWIRQDVPFDGFPGRRQRVDGRQIDWQAEAGGGESGWSRAIVNAAAIVRHPTDLAVRRLLEPAMLPAMLSQPYPPKGWRVAGAGIWKEGPQPWTTGTDDAGATRRWADLLQRDIALQVPAHEKSRVLLDLGDYFCGYPTLRLSGGAGAAIRVGWAEALFKHPPGKERASAKGRRDQVEGKYFHGFEDRFVAGGGSARVYGPLSWQTGRFVQIVIENGGEPLTVEAWRLEESRFPTALDTRLTVSQPEWGQVQGIMERTLAVNSHDGYFDCPYYERLSYISDNRTTALVSYAMGGGDLLARKALRVFAGAQMPDGLLASRHPSRVRQSIPPFSLAWTLMLADFALWRGDLDFVRTLAPTARRILDTFLLQRDARGLMHSPPGWNFTDWVPTWNSGVPPDGAGVSGVLNWLLVHALDRQARLEGWLGEGELQARWHRLADELGAAVWGAFYDEPRGLLADDLGHGSFSQHAQTYALLSGRVPAPSRRPLADALLADASLTPATLFFRHYVIEALAGEGRAREAWKLLDLWFALPGQGFVTTPEQPEPSRSDCHVWATHPCYHMVTTWAGIRPLTPGGRTVAVTPGLPDGVEVRARVELPAGSVEVAAAGGGSAHVQVSGGIELIEREDVLPL